MKSTRVSESSSQATSRYDRFHRIDELGGTALAGSPTDFGKLIAEETEKWGKVIRAANIKPE
jgi:hypothetical protein